MLKYFKKAEKSGDGLQEGWIKLEEEKIAEKLGKILMKQTQFQNSLTDCMKKKKYFWYNYYYYYYDFYHWTFSEKVNRSNKVILIFLYFISVSDLFYFNIDPDPRIRFVE